MIVDCKHCGAKNKLPTAGKAEDYENKIFKCSKCKEPLFKKKDKPKAIKEEPKMHSITSLEALSEQFDSEQMMPPETFVTKGYGGLIFECGCGDIHGVNESDVEVVGCFRPVGFLFKCSSHYTRVNIKGWLTQRCESLYTIKNSDMKTWVGDLNL